MAKVAANIPSAWSIGVSSGLLPHMSKFTYAIILDELIGRMMLEEVSEEQSKWVSALDGMIREKMGWHVEK